MGYGERARPSDEDRNRPLHEGKELPPLPFLPEREWISGKITKVDYRFVYFKGKQQFAEDKEGNQILDANDQPIPRKEFNIEISCHEFKLPNDKGPRKCWIKLGASLDTRANLPKFLKKMEMQRESNPTPQEIIEYLEGLEIKFQLANVTANNGKEYQQVVWDAVKLNLGA
jgi:hypothetical protein